MRYRVHRVAISRACILLMVAASGAGCGSPEASESGTAASDARPDASSGVSPDLARFFDGVRGTFVLLGPDAQARHDPERAATRVLPASTFKIPNSLIALETGVADGPDFALERDTIRVPREEWWPAAWAEDHTFRTALPGSVVWYYQELARRIGPDRMRESLQRFDYGNREISGGIDRFWLTGGLRISAEEQVEFLRRFYNGELGVSDRSTRLVRELLVMEESADYRLSGKTGWAGLGEGDAPDIGWFVGYLERGPDVYFFALNIDIERADDVAARVSITKAILSDLGLMQASGS